MAETTGGSGASDGATTTTTTDMTKPDTAATTTTTATEDESKWQALAKKHEADLRKAQKELDAARAAAMTDQEKAVAQAKATGRAEALKEAGALLVDAKVEAAAAGRGIDVAALLEGLDRSKFLDAEGKPDAKAITAWVDKLAPANRTANGRPDTGQGNRGAAPDSQDFNQMIRRAAGRAG